VTRRTRGLGPRAAALAVALIGVVALGGTALAGHVTSGVKSYTGCLAGGDGVIIKVAEGNAPKSACTGGQTQVHLSGGDLTSVAVQAGGGLSGGGTDGGVTVSLRRDCANGEIVKWNGTAWVCSADSNSTYTAGTGLDLNGSDLSVEPGYRVKNTPDCSSGQFATGFDTDGDIQCAAPPAASALQAFSATVGHVTLAGRTSVLSKTLPPGKYAFMVSVELVNNDLDSTSWASCDVSRTGATLASTGTHIVDDIADYETLSLTGVVDHGGGSILLACDEEHADVDVDSATFVAIKVDSLG
jgi:hypothetical protein